MSRAAPGSSLFLRIFIWFWLATCMIVAAGMVITTVVGAARHNALDGVEPAALVREARAQMALGGVGALRQWIRASEARYATLKIYVVDHGVQDILGRRLQPRLEDRLGAHIEEGDFAAANGTPLPGPLPGKPVSWWDIHDLVSPDGDHYELGFLPFDPPHLEALGDSDLPLLLLAAFALSAPICWLLARHISRPVRELERGAQAFGDGDAKLRLDGALLARRDEFGALARAFDGMAENVAELLASKENLLRDVSHELRSPLARLRLGLELARRDAGAGLALDRRFDRIEQECAHLDQMVGQLLHLARLRGAPSDMPEPLDLAVIISQVVGDARFEAQAARRRVAWTAPPLPLTMLGVPLLLRSVLENVLRNALRHAPEDSAIVLRAWREDGDIVVEIGDHGSGVQEHELARLFQPFYRAGGDAQQDGDGAGLGLTIAATMVARHGGGMAARNRGEGDDMDENGRRSGLIVSIRLPGL